jgi:hypothetical protein
MSPAEIAWRSRAAFRIAIDRLHVSIVAPRWDRRDLARRLTPTAGFSDARTALRQRRWAEADAALAHHIEEGTQRFVIGRKTKAQVIDRIWREFPESRDAAAARADRVLSGDYDVLGYRGLRFTRPALPALRRAPDWHFDPVHDRRAPRDFWASVPYLDPACGDHKIIWELNRHQHWLALGRAFWLTGERCYRDRFLEEFKDWLEENPPLVGINWASMLELAFRSLSWIWALHLFADGGPTGRGPAKGEDHVPNADARPWVADLLLGLDVQLTQIERNLSRYFSPNTHLTGEALALYVAGRALPMLAASERRASVGREILVREIGRQIAPDGGHSERSTHYHKYTLDFYLFALAIARLTEDPVAPEFERAASQLASAARVLADDRGLLPHVGDDDAGALLPFTGRAPDDVSDSLGIAAALLGRDDLKIGPVPEEAWWLLAGSTLAPSLDTLTGAPVAGRPSSAALRDTGYYVSRSPEGDHLVIDGGPHGFLNAGHAHADSLSLTFERRGRPLLIDPGTACYTIDAAVRDRFRSTAMHNTLVVDDRPQSIPAGPFHWARTAAATVHRWHCDVGFDYFDGAHDGYLPMRHRRRVLALHDDLLVVADLLDATGPHRASVHWHVDPRWQVEVRGPRAWLLLDGQCVEFVAGTGALEAVSADRKSGLGWYSPMYGRIEPATTLRITRQGSGPIWMVGIFGLDPRNPIVSVDMVPVWAEAHVLVEPAALRIAREQSTDYFLIADYASQRATCRVANFETDARALLFRIRGAAQTPVAVVDASIVRVGGRNAPVSSYQSPVPRHQADICVESPAS